MPQHGSAVFGLFFASPDCIDYNGCRKAKKRVGRVKQLQTPIDEAAASSKYCRFGLGTLHSYARACLLAPVGEAYSAGSTMRIPVLRANGCRQDQLGQRSGATNFPVASNETRRYIRLLS